MDSPASSSSRQKSAQTSPSPRIHSTPPTPISPSKIPRLSLHLPKDKPLEEQMGMAQKPGASQSGDILSQIIAGNPESPSDPPETSSRGEKSKEVQEDYGEPLVVMPLTLARANEMAKAEKVDIKGKGKAVMHSRSNSTSQIPKQPKTVAFGRQCLIVADIVPLKRESRKVSLEPFLSPSSSKMGSVSSAIPLQELKINKSPSSSSQKSSQTGDKSAASGGTGSKKSSDPRPSSAVSIADQNRASQQSASAFIAVRSAEYVEALCYGPLDYAALFKAQKDVKMGRTVLDYSLLKRLDNILFHRSDLEREHLQDGAIRSHIINAEARLLFDIQHFIITAALVPAHEHLSVDGAVDPEPLIKFINDIEALVQYILEDLRKQSLFSGLSENLNLVGFILERREFAKTSDGPSFYFRHALPPITLKYAQGLCETICGLFPYGRYFISAAEVNPRDSFSPIHFHHPNSGIGDTGTMMDNYFKGTGLLGNVMAEDYRQFLRGAFPFLAGLGRDPNSLMRPERERNMRTDAAFIENGVFKFVRTTFIREHLMVDKDRKIRIYADDYPGTRFLLYFNHRIARYSAQSPDLTA
jgi:hypothetical protein